MIQETQYCKTQMINCTSTYSLLIFCLENEVKIMDSFYLDFTKIFDTSPTVFFWRNWLLVAWMRTLFAG